MGNVATWQSRDSNTYTLTHHHSVIIRRIPENTAGLRYRISPVYILWDTQTIPNAFAQKIQNSQGVSSSPRLRSARCPACEVIRCCSWDIVFLDVSRSYKVPTIKPQKKLWATWIGKIFCAWLLFDKETHIFSTAQLQATARYPVRDWCLARFSTVHVCDMTVSLERPSHVAWLQWKPWATDT